MHCGQKRPEYKYSMQKIAVSIVEVPAEISSLQRKGHSLVTITPVRSCNHKIIVVQKFGNESVE